jgi:hypothetical protein
MADFKMNIDKDNLNSCVYCGHFDPNYDENDMVMHYAKDCPMVSNSINLNYSYTNVIYVNKLKKYQL